MRKIYTKKAIWDMVGVCLLFAIVENVKEWIGNKPDYGLREIVILGIIYIGVSVHCRVRR